LRTNGCRQAKSLGALGMLICLARGFPSLFKAQQQRHWIRPFDQSAAGLSGLTMGIIGLGQVGRTVARRARVFEMEVVAVDTHAVPQPEYVSALWLTDDGLPRLLQRSDVVVVAAPLTPETRHLVRPEQLAMLKPSSYLLGISRDDVIDEVALAKALREGKLAGAGLDVQEQEPLPADSDLWDAPNLILTPHCAGQSDQTTVGVTDLFMENLRRYLAGESLINLIDKQRGY
jgi:D-2-hydroxyacid dehydrogenase (NADP+)